MTSSDKQTCMLHGAAQKRGGECRREAEPGAQVVSCGVCRHGATSVGEFRDEGYLPDAMTNFLALLGWNEGDGSEREMYSLGELTQAFSLGRITKSGAVFDKTKLSWMNGASAPPRRHARPWRRTALSRPQQRRYRNPRGPNAALKAASLTFNYISWRRAEGRVS